MQTLSPEQDALTNAHTDVYMRTNFPQLSALVDEHAKIRNTIKQQSVNLHLLKKENEMLAQVLEEQKSEVTRLKKENAALQQKLSGQGKKKDEVPSVTSVAVE